MTALPVTEATRMTIRIARRRADDLPAYFSVPSSASGTEITFVVPFEESASAGMKLVTNCPTSGSIVRFCRQACHEDWTCSISAFCAGVYDYAVSDMCDALVDQGRFSILPDVPPEGLDQIRLQTLVPKFMGALSRWPSIVEASCHLGGYNTIHFAPMQERGHSDSPYSIRDQLVLDPGLLEAEQRQLSLSGQWALFRTCLEACRRTTKMLLLVDVVWNHTSCDSPWLIEHPEAGFNADNTPHLRPAMLIDYAIYEFGLQMTQVYRLCNVIADEAQLASVLDVFFKVHLPKYRVHEYFIFSAQDILQSLSLQGSSSAESFAAEWPISEALQATTMDAKVYYLVKYFASSSNTWERKVFPFPRQVLLQLAGSATNLVALVDALLGALSNLYESKLAKLQSNMYHRIEYERLAEHGPQLGPIDERHPLLSPYFTRKPKVPETSALAADADSDAIFDRYHFFANNGWIWDADPFVDFASPESDAYFVRDIIVWGDCVKLRYGAQQSDSPWLWSHMRSYTEQLAELFDGFRIDNCHSTPVPVAKYLLQAARAVRPNLYVFAELFTGRAERDRYFVSELGLHSLLRETLVCSTLPELISQLWKSGGRSVGSLRPMDWQERSMPHVLLMDCTHDNQMPAEKGCHPAHALSLAALVAFGACATGSSKGFDELCSHQLDFIRGNSLRYPVEVERGSRYISGAGIVPVKKRLNELHGRLVKFTEKHIDDQFGGELVQVTRAHPDTLESYLLITRTGFRYDAPDAFPGVIAPLRLANVDVDVVLCARLRLQPDLDDELFRPKGTAEYIWGRACELEYGEGSTDVAGFICVQASERGTDITFHAEGWLPGSVLILRKTPRHTFRDGVQMLSAALASPVTCVAHLGLLDFNVLLYRCGPEESNGGHDGAYVIPGHGRLFYCGLMGLYQAFLKPVRENDLGGSLCSHLRQGTWLMDYTTRRLRRYCRDATALEKPLLWLESMFSSIKCLPSFYHPKYMWLVLKALVEACWRRIFELMGLVQLPLDPLGLKARLALTSVALIGRVKSASLFPVHQPALYESMHAFLDLASATLRHDHVSAFVHSASSLRLGGSSCRSLTLLPSLSAGLEHFSVRHMRVWGRDVFISLPGLFLATNRLSDAVAHLAAFASCLRHDGLIPNLLDSGRYPRYNARDSVWWFLRALRATCIWLDKHEPASSRRLSQALLEMQIPLRFPDQSAYCHWESAAAYSRSMRMIDIVQSVLSSHMRGIDFIELSGTSKPLDHAMSELGYRVVAQADLDDTQPGKATGLVLGGNAWNCGTWMDKMGDSYKAHTIGVPATPRDGAAIELAALLHAALEWVATQLAADYGDVLRSPQGHMSYAEWAQLIKTRFEPCYYLQRDDGSALYRDAFGATTGDTQLRPNYILALSLSPGLFEPRHAVQALQMAEERLVARKGIRTLEPQDPHYRPSYDPSNDSEDGSVAHGFNYHNGPEWLWLFGHYLKAKWHFCGEKKASLFQLMRLLGPHREQLETSPGAGLVELTQADDVPCHFGSEVQAWSLATILEFIHFMEDLGICSR